MLNLDTGKGATESRRTMRSVKKWPFNLLLLAWSTTAICAAISHLCMPEWTAHYTTWQSSPYWQREIGYFDLLLSSAFIWVARQDDVSLKIKACGAIACLSLALGTNHLQGWLAEAQVFHVVFTLGNLLALAWGVGCILHAKKADFFKNAIR